MPSPAETPSPEALAIVIDEAMAARDEATRLLAALAEISGRASVGALHSAGHAALTACASSVTPDLAQAAAMIREARRRLRLAAGGRRTA